MSDPYLTPPDRPNDRPQQPYTPQPYAPGTQPQPYPYGAHGSPQPAGGRRDVELPPAPSSVRALLAVMVTGAALAVVGVVLSLLATGDVTDELLRGLEQAQLEGVDAEDVAAVGTPLIIGTIVFFGLIEIGLWLLFARLFSRARARAGGTVLGGLNALLSLVGIGVAVTTTDRLLSVVMLTVVVAGLVLLWMPATNEWFRFAKGGREGRV